MKTITKIKINFQKVLIIITMLFSAFVLGALVCGSAEHLWGWTVSVAAIGVFVLVLGLCAWVWHSVNEEAEAALEEAAEELETEMTEAETVK